MIEINSMPEQLKSLVTEKGIPVDSILLAACSDMNRDDVHCDNWLIATDTDLIVIGGSNIIVPKKGKKVTDSNRLTVSFGEISYDYYETSKLRDFKIESLISTSRLIATDTDSGANVLVTYLTNAKREDLSLFCEYLNQYKDKGEITEKENKKEQTCCPKCGLRYPDPNRKICPKCMDKSSVIKRLGVFLLKYKLSVATIIGTLVLSSALGVLAPYVSSGFFYDQVLNKAGKFYGQILLVIGIIIGTRVLSLFVNMLTGIVSAKVAANISYDLKKTIFNSIERLSISFFTNRQTGGLMNQVNNDSNSIYWFFVDGAPYFLINIVQATVVLIIMFVIRWQLAVITLCVFPLIIFGISKLFARIRKLYAKRYSRSRAMNSTLSDVLSGVRVVKAFSKEKDAVRRFDRQSRETANEDRNVSRFNATAFPAVTLTLMVTNVLILGIGGWTVIQGEITYGMLLTFMAYMNMIYNPMYFFVDMVYWAGECLNSMQRLIEVMDAVPEVVESENPIPLDHLEGRVTFNNVVFGYEKSRKIIDGISFDIEPGKAIGIVGHSGAGKSTLVNLLIRLYDVSEGEILIDGINVKDLSFDDLRRNIAIVSQETYLFAGTILENIRYAKPDATNEEVIVASKISGAHDFIVKLPDAYSTRIGFGNKELSGGERQRVSIARAILRNPKILILDEATSAMDTATERQIQNALEKLVTGRTTIMIAHRLSTLRDVDHLIVIEDGKMPETGTHMELINKKGIYYNLYKLQAEALKNVGIEA